MSENIQKVAIVDAPPAEAPKLSKEYLKQLDEKNALDESGLSEIEKERLNNARAEEHQRLLRGQIPDSKVEAAVHEKRIGEAEKKLAEAQAEVDALKAAAAAKIEEAEKREKEAEKKANELKSDLKKN